MWKPGALSRRAFVRTLIVAAGAVLTGCGLDRDDEPAPGKIRLTQWYHQYGEEGTHAAALRYAQEYTRLHPHLEIKVVWLPGDYSTKLATGLIAGRGPDIFEANLSAILGSISAGHVLALDELVSELERQDFDPSSLALNTFKGKLYGIPEVLDPCLLYYRPSLLRAAGLPPPATADDVIATAKALTGRRTKGLFAGNDGGMTALLGAVPWSAGADFLVDGRIAFDTPQMAVAFTKIKQLYDSGSLLIGAPTDWWDPAAFTENLAAMQWTGLWAQKDIVAAYGDDVGVLPWPPLSHAPEGAPVVPISGWAECLNANSPHLPEAKHYARWLWIENTTDQLDWCTAYGSHIPPRRSVVASARSLTGGLTGQAVENARRYGRIFPATWNSAMESILLQALSRVVRQNRPAAAEIHVAAQRCALELADQSTS